MTEQTLDRKDLKILAYKERLSAALDENADLRVEVTFLSQQLQATQAELSEYARDDLTDVKSNAEETDASSDED